MTTENSNFSNLGLCLKLQNSIAKAGYKIPTEVQKLAIPAILNKQDIIGISQTGTGKTAAFALPIIDMLAKGRSKARMPRSLILTPTRELALQITEQFKKFTSEIKLNLISLIGGESIERQTKFLNSNIDIIIATPGRLLDHIKRGTILLNSIETIVIDEADRMLDMGFIKDVENIVKVLQASHTTILFSATMSKPIEKLATTYLKNPVRIETARQASVAQTITQTWIKNTSTLEHKKNMLLELLKAEQNNIINAIIFCNRKLDSGKMQKWLVKQGFNAAALHGDVRQNMRTKILRDFRKGKHQLLVATDIAARGLDIDEIGYVFNFDLPRNKEDYIHRIGRTGRAGRSGKAFNIVSKADMPKAKEIEKMTKQKIKWDIFEPIAV